MKMLEERVNELITEFGPILPGKFPTYKQLKLMLTADGYPAEQIDRWFAVQAASYLEAEESDRPQLFPSDVYLVLDHDNKQPLAFWTEGATKIIPLDIDNCESWRAANELRATLKAEGLFGQE